MSDQGYVFDDEIELPFLDDQCRLDPTFDGLVVIARSVDLDTWMEADELTDGGLTPTKANAERIERFTEIVAESLVSWNLKDRSGAPVPCDLAGLRSQPKPLRTAIANAWIRGQIGVTPDFGDGSASGSPTAQIPVEPLAS